MVEGKRIASVDGWKGVSILLVLLDHWQPRVNGHGHISWLEHIGQHGVAFFFVISGYLITSNLLYRQEGLGRFYLRRFFRLMPAAWVYILALYAARHVLETGQLRGSVVACLFFFRNYRIVSTDSLLTAQFWSLSVEEQFYLIWPTILLFARRRAAAIIAVLGAVAVAVLRLSQWQLLTGSNMPMSFFTQYRADALLLGCLAALIPTEWKQRAARISPWLLLAGVLWCIPRNPVLIPLHESVLFALLLLSTTHRAPSRGSFWLWRPLQATGRACYSLYLWQQIGLVLALRDQKLLLYYVPLALILGIASYFLVERPGIRLGRKMEKWLERRHEAAAAA